MTNNQSEGSILLFFNESFVSGLKRCEMDGVTFLILWSLLWDFQLTFSLGSDLSLGRLNSHRELKGQEDAQEVDFMVMKAERKVRRDFSWLAELVRQASTQLFSRRQFTYEDHCSSTVAATAHLLNSWCFWASSPLKCVSFFKRSLTCTYSWIFLVYAAADVSLKMRRKSSQMRKWTAAACCTLSAVL